MLRTSRLPSGLIPESSPSRCEWLLALEWTLSLWSGLWSAFQHAVFTTHNRGCSSTHTTHTPCQYLEELCTEFDLQNGTLVSSATRPYAFVKLDTFIKNTWKL